MNDREEHALRQSYEGQIANLKREVYARQQDVAVRDREIARLSRVVADLLRQARAPQAKPKGPPDKPSPHAQTDPMRGLHETQYGTGPRRLAAGDW